jgi:hypothetical protein
MKWINSYDFGVSSKCYIMMIKIEDSVGQVSQKSQIDGLNIYYGRLSHHQELELTSVSQL